MSEDLSKRPKKDEEDDDDDEDDDFDEEGNAEEEESAGWVDEKPSAKETEEDDENDSPVKVESVKNNTDSNPPLSSASSSSSLSPAKALPDRLMPKQVGSVDEAVKTLLRPNSRPGSRLLVTVEFDQLSIDPDEVRKKLQEEREKMARNKQDGGEGGEGEAVEYTATELFQKLQALRPQDNKEGDASGSAGVVPPLNVANVGDSNKVESPRPVSPRAAELADMIEKAVEREQQELLRKKQEQEQQQASEQTDETEELVSPRKRKAGLKFWKKDKKDDKEKEKDKKDKKKVK